MFFKYLQKRLLHQSKSKVFVSLYDRNWFIRRIREITLRILLSTTYPFINHLVQLRDRTALIEYNLLSIALYDNHLTMEYTSSCFMKACDVRVHRHIAEN